MGHYVFDSRVLAAPPPQDRRRDAWHDLWITVNRMLAYLAYFRAVDPQAQTVAAYLERFAAAFDEPPPDPWTHTRAATPPEIAELLQVYHQEIAPLWPLFHPDRLENEA